MCLAANPTIAVVADYTSYQVGDAVQIRLQPASQGTISIHYAGEDRPLVTNVPVAGSEYSKVWNIPADARTGRYTVDLTTASGTRMAAAASFAVHRQSAKVLSVDLDKTFYTAGDSVNPTIVVRNVSDRALDHVQIEFESYTYPWIAPNPDEPPAWKTIIENSLTLAPGAEKEFHVNKAAVVQADKEPVAIYYSVVIRDSQNPDHIYDLAFAPPAFTVPVNSPLPKQYPFLYLYWHLADVRKSEAYRNFYPPEYVSPFIKFDTGHTIFPTGTAPVMPFSIPTKGLPKASAIRTRVLDAAGRQLESQKLSGPVGGSHSALMGSRKPGLYVLQVSIEDASGASIAQNRIEVAVDDLPKSILIFCAHQDDDTAHPGMIRAAVENHIPIHFVYLTGGDAGGCDRFYMHSCDAARAMDFGEVRMEEARASLGHLGVPPENIFFLGLPDGGLGQIWNAKESHPYLSVLLASEYSPYREAAVPNLPYARGPVINALKQFIARFKPDLVVTGHPDERHVDHRLNNWLVVQAMQEMVAEQTLAPTTQLLVDQVYGERPGKHAPYQFQKHVFFVSGEVARMGQEATWYYQTQDGNHQQSAITDFAKLPRDEPYPHFTIVDWQRHKGWNEEPNVAAGHE